MLKEKKVNMGWPNFFNPEKAILRKSENKKATAINKKQIIDVEDSDELMQDNRLANVLKDRDRHLVEWPESQDFKITVSI